MSYNASNWLHDGLKDVDLTLSEYAVLSYLVHAADDKTGKCFPTITTIAAHSRCGKRSVDRALRGLKEKQFIFVTHRQSFRGNPPVNVYQLPEEALLSPRKQREVRHCGVSRSLETRQFDGGETPIRQGRHANLTGERCHCGVQKKEGEESREERIKETPSETLGTSLPDTSGEKPSRKKMDRETGTTDSLSNAEKSPEEVFEHYQGKHSKPDLSAYWLAIVPAMLPEMGMPTSLTDQGMGQLKSLHKAIGPDRFHATVYAVVEQWRKFTLFAENNASAFKSPRQPDLGYLVKYVQAALSFVEAERREADQLRKWKRDQDAAEALRKRRRAEEDAKREAEQKQKEQERALIEQVLDEQGYSGRRKAGVKRQVNADLEQEWRKEHPDDSLTLEIVRELVQCPDEVMRNMFG